MTSIVVDAHTHIGKSTFFPDLSVTPDSLIGQLNTFSINKAIVMPLERDYVVDVHRANVSISNAVEKYPDRLIGVCTANPWHSGATEEVETSIKNLKLKGLKLHPNIQGFYVNHPMVYPLIEKAENLRVPVIVHSGEPLYSLPHSIRDLAEVFPRVTFIMAHMGLTDFGGDAVFCARHTDNIVLETSHMAQHQRIERAVREFGADRIIYGSDIPKGRMEIEMKKIEVCSLADDERRKIMGDNAARIFGI